MDGQWAMVQLQLQVKVYGDVCLMHVIVPFLWLCQLCIGCLPTSLMLSARDMLLLILMKLKLSLEHQDLAWRFQISVFKVSQIINAAIPEAAKQLKFHDSLASRDRHLRAMPLKFKRLHQNCRVIIDCRERFIEQQHARAICPIHITRVTRQ